jgi:predicted transcriptional regulator
VVASSALALTFIIIGCFAAQMYQQSTFRYISTERSGHHLVVINSSVTSYKAITINQYTLIAVPSLINLQSPNISQNSLLTNSTRYQIYDYVTQNPGLQFRALCGALCLPVGLAEYHLGVLVRAGLVSFVRDGRYKRFFTSKRFSKWEIMLICLLRHKTAKKIVETLLRKRQLSHGRLAGEVAITSQALTWQMKTLGNTEFLLQVNDGLKTIYSLDTSYEPMLQKYLAIVK